MDINKLIEDHLDSVKKAAYHFYKSVPDKYRGTVALEDLIGAGNVGLVEAASKFKEGGEAKFSTYAYKWVNGAIMAELNFYIGANALLLDAETMDSIPSQANNTEETATGAYDISDIPEEKQVEIITGKLNELGLSGEEIRVYLATHGIGRMKVTNLHSIARELGRREMDIRRLNQSAERKIRKGYYDA
ncbi:MAG: sigma-70 family RNA polymerase sigma factor [Lachnospiraceae bacterium]|nr:sigma-70 family RNA polymerase sigma factor [Lachnospiraceae bacterium]